MNIFRLFLFGILLSIAAFAQEAIVDEKIESALKTSNSVNVIVILKEPQTEVRSAASNEEILEKTKQEVAEIKQEFLEELKPQEGFGVASSDLQVTRTFETVNAITATISEEGLEELKDNPAVEKIILEPIFHVSLIDSAPLINADHVHNISVSSTRLNGSGMIACVLDSGIELNHSAFTGRLLPGYDFVNNDSSPDDDMANSHGTHVSGILGGLTPNGTGVAPAIQIIPIKVCDNTGSCSGGAMLSGIDYCNNLTMTYNISVLSMSISDAGQYTSANCPTYFDSALNTSNNLGVIPVMASGNDGYTSGISYPACSPYSLSVGSTTKLDAMSSFTNRGGNRLDILAPGSSIISAIRGNTAGVLSGTSMATPHVSGLIALIQQNENLSARPRLNITQIRSILQTTGVPVSGYQRIDAYNAITKLNRNYTINTSGKTVFYQAGGQFSSVTYDNVSDFAGFGECAILEANSVYVNETACPQFNSTANIVLSGLTGDIAQPLRNGAPCGAFCSNVSYTAGTLSFSVTSFSNYSANVSNYARMNITSSTTLVSNTSAILNISGDHLMVDCAGFNVLGIESFGQDNITLMNCSINGQVTISNLTNSEIHYANITSNGTWMTISNSSVDFFNLTFSNQNGEIHYMNSTTAGTSTVNQTNLRITNGQAYVNSSQLQWLNITAQVTLLNLSSAGSSSAFSPAAAFSQVPIIDENDNGTFVRCPTSVCNQTRFYSDRLIFITQHFTTINSTSSFPVLINDSSTLTTNIMVNGSAVEFNNNSIELDCQGFTMTGNGTGTAVSATGRNNVTVRNCIVANFAEGVSVISSTNSTVQNNTVSNSVNDAIVITSGLNSTVTLNRVANNTNGISISSSPNSTIVSNNATNSTSQHIILSSSANLNVSLNTILSFGTVGIDFVNSDNSSARFNTVTDASTAFSASGGTTNTTFASNIVTNATTGFLMASNTDGNVSFNLITNATTMIFCISANNMTISSNNGSGATTGISLNTCSNTTISSNRINATNAITATVGSGSNNIIQSNILNVTNTAINVLSQTNLSVTSNAINATNVGIFISTSTNIVNVSSNNVNSSGASISVNANNATIHLNFVNTTATGISSGGDSISISSNNISSTSVGISITSGNNINITENNFTGTGSVSLAGSNYAVLNNRGSIALQTSGTGVVNGTFANQSYLNNLISGSNLTFSNSTIQITITFSGTAQNMTFLNTTFNIPLQPNTTWISSSALSSNISFTNTTFTNSSNLINFPNNFTLPASASVTTTNLVINDVRARAANTLTFLNQSAQITLSNASTSIITVDLQDDETFTICTAPRCTLVSFNGSQIVFNVTGFTTYSTSGGGVNVTLSKTDSQNIVNSGQVFTYQINFTVINGTSFNTTIQENYPSQLIFLNASPSPNVSNNVWLAGNLTATEVFQINVTVQVNNSVLSSVVINNTVNSSFANSTGNIFTANVTENTTINVTFPVTVSTDVTLPGNITLAGSAFIFNTSNILFNCNGSSIIGSGSGVALNLTNASNVSIINCILQNFTTDVALFNSTLANITNTTFITPTVWLSTNGASNATLINVTFQNSQGALTSLAQITVPSNTSINTSNLQITLAQAFLNSTDLPFLNVSFRVRLDNLTLTNTTILADYNESNIFQICTVCTFVSYNGSTLIFDVTHFTTYTAVEGGVNFTITKTASPDPVTPGGQLTYTITVTVNSGFAHNITVVENPPSELTFVSSTPANISNNTWMLQNLSTGQSAQINAIYTVNSSFTGTINNTINVTFLNNTNQTITTQVNSTSTAAFSQGGGQGGGGGGGGTGSVCPPICQNPSYRGLPQCSSCPPPAANQTPAPSSFPIPTQIQEPLTQNSELKQETAQTADQTQTLEQQAGDNLAQTKLSEQKEKSKSSSYTSIGFPLIAIILMAAVLVYILLQRRKPNKILEEIKQSQRKIEQLEKRIKK